jgi:hypothetical protein
VSKCDLKIDWATHEAAKYACENWHYSGCLPAGKLVKVGAWENGKFIGVVLFGRGANNRMAQAYNLKQDQAAELVRIALCKHSTPVSRIAALAMKFLRKANEGLRLIVSYADPKQGHHGGIYQAGNWIYAGSSQAQRELLVNGIFMHKRSAFSKFGTASPSEIHAKTGLKVEWAPLEWKHIYLMPLDTEMRVKILPLARPYPKRAGSDTTDTAPFQGAKGGSIPTPALHLPTA